MTGMEIRTFPIIKISAVEVVVACVRNMTIGLQPMIVQMEFIVKHYPKLIVVTRTVAKEVPNHCNSSSLRGLEHRQGWKSAM